MTWCTYAQSMTAEQASIEDINLKLEQILQLLKLYRDVPADIRQIKSDVQAIHTQISKK